MRDNGVVRKQQAGAAFGDAAVRKGWEVGLVLEADPSTYTYRVKTAQGLYESVGRKVEAAGDASVLPIETLVLIHHELGFPIIDGVLQMGAGEQAAIKSQISEVPGIGGEDAYNPTNGATYRPRNMPQDMTPGSWARSGQLGNLIAMLANGTNVVKSAPFAQIRTHALTSMVQVLAENYEHISGMGDLRIKNDDGKVSLTWRAGTDQKTETGPRLEKWTVRLDVGAAGDLFDFRITTPDDKTLARLHFSPDGEIDFTGLDGINITSGADYKESVRGDKKSTVRGNLEETVKKDAKQAFEQGREVTVSGIDQHKVGQDLIQTIRRNLEEFVGGRHTSRIMGPIVPTPGAIAQNVDFVGGGFEHVLGNPAKGGIPTGLQSGNWISYFGGYNFYTGLTPGLSNFKVHSIYPGSVLLGIDGAAIYNPATGLHTLTSAPVTFGLVKFEPFAAMMQSLLLWMDLHTHLTAMGPTLPAGTAPTGPVTPAISPQVAGLTTIRVRVGP